MHDNDNTLDSERFNVDCVVPFLLDNCNVRGRIISLNESVDTILSQHRYPEPLSQLLGEMVVVATMLGDMLKIEQMLTVQIGGAGPIHTAIVDYMPGGLVRGYIGYDEEEFNEKASLSDESLSFFDLTGTGHLSISVDPGNEEQRYQGIVELQEKSFADTVFHYFTQSEQLETMVRIAVEKSDTWKARGVMVQRLPQGEDVWETASIFVSSLGGQELLDSAITTQDLLHRLFHEYDVRLFDPRDVRHQCRCSRERALCLLQQLPEEEIVALRKEKNIVVQCQFCSKEQEFTEDEIAASKE